MKTMPVLLALFMLATTSASAKKKDMPVYDQTGTVSLTVFNSDYHASMTVNGEAYYARCNADDNSVSCSDTAGVWEIKLADGRTLILGKRAYDFKSHTWVNPLAAELLASGVKSE